MLSKDGWFTVSIKSGGNTLSEYYHKGDVFVLGAKGDYYEIALRNTSPRRAIAVVNIDGLCAVDGREFLGDGLGYILEPGVLVTIDCWRFQNSQCPPLQFGYLPSGFEKEMDEPGNPGVIEALFFFEQTKPYYSPNWLAQSGYNKRTIQRRGWGTKDEERVIREQFAKEHSPISTIVIQYEERSALEKMGVFNLPSE